MKKIIIALVALVIAVNAHAWTLSETFESLTTGVTADSSQVVDDISDISTCYERVSTDYSHSGSKAWKLFHGDTRETCAQGYHIGGTLAEGDSIWIRTYLYLPSGFTWNGDSFLIVKFIRLALSGAYVSTLVTDPDNYASCGPDDSDSSDRYLVGGIEGGTGSPYCPTDDSRTDTPADMTQTGVWHSVEMYIYLHHSSGIVRVWHNGILSVQATNIETLTSASETITDAGWHHFGGAWNNTPIGDKTYYMDDIVITNEQPTNQDAAGNYMIGPTDWAGSSSHGSRRSGGGNYTLH